MAKNCVFANGGLAGEWRDPLFAWETDICVYWNEHHVYMARIVEYLLLFRVRGIIIFPVAARIPKQNRREFQNTPIYIQYAKSGLRISPPQAVFSCLYALLTLATSPPPPPAAGPPLVQSPGAPQCPRCRVLPALPPQASSRCPQKDPVCARPEHRCRQPPA